MDASEDTQYTPMPKNHAADDDDDDVVKGSSTSM